MSSCDFHLKLFYAEIISRSFNAHQKSTASSHRLTITLKWKKNFFHWILYFMLCFLLSFGSWLRPCSVHASVGWRICLFCCHLSPSFSSLQWHESITQMNRRSRSHHCLRCCFINWHRQWQLEWLIASHWYAMSIQTQNWAIFAHTNIITYRVRLGLRWSCTWKQHIGWIPILVDQWCDSLY